MPNGWEWCIIGNLFNHNNGKQLNRSNSSGELMSYITTSNLYWNGFILNNLKKMPFEIKEIERCQAIKGDLLVCEGGDIGRSCIWENDEPIMLQNHIHKLRAYLPLCTRYFYYIFYLYNLSGLIGGKGIGIQGFSSQTLHTTRIPLPPLAEQQRIVEKIEELIPHIELYGKAQTELDTLNKNIKEQLKKSVLQYAIGGKLVPQDEAEGTAEELLLQIQAEKQKLYEENKLKKKDLEHSTIFKGEDNKYYEKIGKNVTEITDDMLLDLPVGWRWCRLKDIVFIFTGATFKKEEVSVENIDIRILRGGNIQPFRLTNRVDDIFLPKDKVKENILLKKNDIVTPAVTSLENIGKMARVESDLESTTVGGFVLILRQFYCNDIVSKYLLALLSSPVLIDYIKSITNKSGQAFYNISKNRLEMTLLPLPPLAEQQRIVESIDAIFRCIEN
nr:restriction endonuclease subunit S [Capnocytophaga leadbetteri]